MIFLAICFALIGIRILFSRVLPFRLLSVSTYSLAGILVFVGLGLEFDRFYDPWLSVLIISVFYLFFLLGELAGKRIKINTKKYATLGKSVLRRPVWRAALLLTFVVYIVLPFIQVLFTGVSLRELLLDTWTTSGVAERSQSLVTHISGQSASANILRSLLTQLTGAWYLSIGIALVYFPRLSFAGLIFYVFTQLIISTGSRSGVMIALVLVVTLWIRVKRRRSLAVIIILILIVVGAFVAMDALLLGRGGIAAEGTLLDRVGRNLKADFAYGGLGLNFARQMGPPPFVTSLNYLERIVVMPVPRVLWPGKPVVDPNWEMTENYRGGYIENVGSISLFTPLGEAVFYFGYWGLIIVPLLYGFTVSWLERLYSTSSSFAGLLAQVYVWAFLGMRHTFYNLFAALITANFVILLILFLASLFWSPRRESEASAAAGR